MIQGTKVTFLGYAYPVLFPITQFQGVAVADPRDIACMMISAIVRGDKVTVAKIVEEIKNLPHVLADFNSIRPRLELLDEGEIKPGFGPWVRAALHASKVGMTPIRIRNWMSQHRNTDLASRPDALTSINSVLAYMIMTDEVDYFINWAGKKAYRMKKSRRRRSTNQRGR